MAKRVSWRGVYSAIVNPFTQSGEFDEKAFRQNVSMSIDEGVGGLVINGHNGEVHLISDEERYRFLRVAIDECRGRVPIVAGAGAIGTLDVIRHCKDARAAGADGVMIEPPYFMRPKPSDLVAHFSRISDATELPIMVYNVPHRAGTDVTTAMMVKLMEHANIAAIKESTGSYDRMMELMEATGDELSFFVGPAGVFGFPGVLMGASGFVDGMQQVAGRDAALLFEYAEKGDVARGVPLQKKLFRLRTLVFEFSTTSPVTLKDAMRLQGRPGGWPRPPLRSAEGAELDRFAQILRSIGYLDGARVAAQ